MKRLKQVNKIYGVGVNDADFPVKVNGKVIWQYNVWRGMLRRCYDKDFQLKQKSYIGCSVAEDWFSFINFYNDVNKMIGSKNEGWQLDKDLLFKGNKVYSKETCCFVPQEVNKLLCKRFSLRGDTPIGVAKYNNKFRAYVMVDGKQKHLGYFDSQKKAFNAYKKAKQDQIKSLAYKWFNQLDLRAYIALYNYEVSIDD